MLGAAPRVLLLAERQRVEMTLRAQTGVASRADGGALGIGEQNAVDDAATKVAARSARARRETRINGTARHPAARAARVRRDP